mmetsp:Transcript_7708/g.11713  ORF Transcript_7708/g.11713 Transcript_7708/m.11713 type:complete len:380 (+) Transcript_7708:242-1381(+)|eukprot:CAMPEP_0203676994 /NCGR_PEP_ID=MMETSP0090-20130426/26760_1 /ASSEMBLY_ACC=CAM_ASM_001088 /TAXON_ID=426623 /ORGANISM="Chaetoceros affinis, Strain CCMP159" /LENGTH=379 /DNA_ID=CAMNT_0050543757 /DNA_START=229 /DNA_END=1368 /DNA_ORIENTATION=-
MRSRLDLYRASIFGGDSGTVTTNDTNRMSRQSQLEDYLRNQRISRATLSRRDLQEYTDVKFFVSPNFASLASFITVLAVMFCLGWMGWGRDVRGNYRDISLISENLFTPILWMVPATWILIFASEAIFILFSFCNSYSHISIIQRGIGFHFFYVNCCQVGWIISYTFDIIWLAFIWMLLNVIFLLWLNVNLYYQDHIDQIPTLNRDGTSQHQQRSSSITTNNNSPSSLDDENASMTVVYEWLIFRLPFQLHLGWAIFNLLLNLNEMAVRYDTWKTALPQISLISLVTLWIIGIFVLFFPKYPVFPIPLIIAWAAGGVWIQLVNQSPSPSAAIVSIYDDLTINRFYGGIIATTVEHVVIAFIRFVYYFANSYSLLHREGQ